MLHANKCGKIILNGDLSEPIPITNDVKQGCVLSPTLFSMMLKQATNDLADEDGMNVM